jgi:hypothetical protein
VVYNDASDSVIFSLEKGQTMTYKDVADLMREQIISEKDSEFVGDVDLLNAIKVAEKEVASMLGFPKKIYKIAVAPNAGFFSAPSDMLNAKLGQVIIGGLRVAPADYVTYENKLNKYPSGPAWVYNYDPRRGGNIFFAPRNSAAVNAVVEYIAEVDNDAVVAEGVTPEAWQNKGIWTVETSAGVFQSIFSQFHYVVAYAASIRIFEMGFEYDKAQYTYSRFQQGIQAFAAHLGLTDVGNLMVPMPQRNDKGSHVG